MIILYIVYYLSGMVKWVQALRVFFIYDFSFHTCTFLASIGLPQITFTPGSCLKGSDIFCNDSVNWGSPVRALILTARKGTLSTVLTARKGTLSTVNALLICVAVFERVWIALRSIGWCSFLPSFSVK